MRFKGHLFLLFAAVFWGSAFVAQSIGARYVGPFSFNASRFLLGAIVLLPFISRPLNRRTDYWKQTILPGALLFLGSFFQQAGIEQTTAGNAGFITGLYVVLIPLMAVVKFKERIPIVVWISVALSVAGLYLISFDASMRVNPGDVLVFSGAFFWAAHVLLISRIVQRLAPIDLAVGQYISCAAFSLLAALFSESFHLDMLYLAIPSILYTGIISIAFGYTLQLFGQRHASASQAGIILSLETVFAALFGFYFLGEDVDGRKMAGMALMLSAMLIVQLPALRSSKKQV